MIEVKIPPVYFHFTQKKKNKNHYGLELMEVSELVDQTGEKGKGVVVAVLDTGIDTEHEDLKDNIIGGANFTKEGRFENFEDGNGHGTHVSGIIKSVAPECSLLICKVLDSRGAGRYDSIIHGIQYATSWRGPKGEKVRVINMSLGGPMDDMRLQRAILKACSAGIVVVVASGNDGDGNPETHETAYPAIYNECVTVGACDSLGKIAEFTNEHLQLDITAPGVEISSTFPKNRYAVLSGTSMATPYVSGALALIIKVGEKEFRRTLTESEIYALLVKCCCSLGHQKSSEGNGLPKLSKLLEECRK